MEIGLLSRSPNCYSTRRLIEAAEYRGIDIKLYDVLKFWLSISQGAPRLFYNGKEIEVPDAILPRIGTSVTRYGTSVIRQFEQLDVYTPSSSAGISNSRDKLRCLQILSKHNVGITPTAFTLRKKDVLPALQHVGGAPVIIKLLEGTQGVGVILADKVEIAHTIVETLNSTKQDVLIQKFVAESKGRDIRAFVVGDRVVAAMRRVAQGQEFRSNVHRGGHTEVVKLDPVYEQAAVRATQILGLHIAGVDMLEGKDGPQIMEINSSPGLEGIEGATGLDIAGTVMDYMSQQINMPEVDIRQRLTVTRGYSVADIIIQPDSHLIGKTICESQLREKDIVVLTLKRGTSVISNPKDSRVLEINDSLLCYGKIAAMRDMIPDRPRRQQIKPLPNTPVTDGTTHDTQEF